MDVAAQELWRGIGMAHARKLGNGPLDHLETNFGVRHFSSAEFEAKLYLMIMAEESLGTAQLLEKIVRRNVRAKFDLLNIAPHHL